MEHKSAVVATQAPLQILPILFILFLLRHLIQQRSLVFVCTLMMERNFVQAAAIINMRRFRRTLDPFLLIHRRQLHGGALIAGLRYVIRLVQLVTTVSYPIRDLNLRNVLRKL